MAFWWLTRSCDRVMQRAYNEQPRQSCLALIFFDEPLLLVCLPISWFYPAKDIREITTCHMRIQDHVHFNILIGNWEMEIGQCTEQSKLTSAIECDAVNFMWSLSSPDSFSSCPLISSDVCWAACLATIADLCIAVSRSVSAVWTILRM